jgi:hypothetical protein
MNTAKQARAAFTSIPTLIAMIALLHPPSARADASLAGPTPTELASRFPEEAPRGRLILSIVAQTGEAFDAGTGPHGARRIVPIIGGSFVGEGGLKGKVLPGGADRQRLRADGVRELDATYELRTDDGIVLMVRNQVIADTLAKDRRYARSVARVAAPDGQYAWLNRRLLVGTLHSLRPDQPYVFVRFYELD